MLNHALAKTVLFLSSGDVSLRYKTREAAGVSGLLAAVPVTGGALLLASFAVLGSPPFGVFLSELTIVRAGFATAARPSRCCCSPCSAWRSSPSPDHDRHGDRQARRMTPWPARTGRAGGPLSPPPPRWSLGLAALLVLGLWIPAGLDTVIRQSAAVIG